MNRVPSTTSSVLTSTNKDGFIKAIPAPHVQESTHWLLHPPWSVAKVGEWVIPITLLKIRLYPAIDKAVWPCSWLPTSCPKVLLPAQCLLLPLYSFLEEKVAFLLSLLEGALSSHLPVCTQIWGPDLKSHAWRGNRDGALVPRQGDMRLVLVHSPQAGISASCWATCFLCSWFLCLSLALKLLHDRAHVVFWTGKLLTLSFLMSHD